MLLCTVLLLGALIGGCGMVSNRTADSVIIPQGHIRVVGNIIKDSSGQNVTLKGFCLSNGVYTEATAPPATTYILTTDDYQTIQNNGANVVRFYIQYSWLNNTANFFTYMDKQLAKMATSNLKAVLSLHYFGVAGSGGGFYNGGSGQPNIPELKAFWKKVSDRYSTNNVVAGYDLLNEPYCSSTFDEITLYSYYTDMIAEIRNNNDNHIIFISDPVNKYDNPSAGHFLSGAFKRLSDDNLVYQFHWYKPIKFTHQTVYDNPYFQLGANYPYAEATETYTGGWYTNSVKVGNTAGNWVTVTSDWLDVDNFIYSNSNLSITDKMGVSILVGNANGQILIDNIRVERAINIANAPVNVTVTNSTFDIPKRYNIHTTTADNHPANWYLVADTDGNGAGVAAEHPAGTLENGWLKFDPSGIFWGTNSWATWKTTWWDGYQNYLDYTYGNSYKYRIIMDVNSSLSAGREVYAAFEFYRLTGQTVQNKNYMNTAITNYYVNWANANNVPLYCGEWGVADPSQGIGRITSFPGAPAQQVNWINDMADILNTKGMHWTYHDYKDFSDLGFGVYDTHNNAEIIHALQNAF